MYTDRELYLNAVDRAVRDFTDRVTCCLSARAEGHYSTAELARATADGDRRRVSFTLHCAFVEGWLSREQCLAQYTRTLRRYDTIECRTPRGADPRDWTPDVIAARVVATWRKRD